MVLIGICGKKSNGKDTIAEYINYKYKFKQYSFAKPLKDICKHLFFLSENQLNGSAKEIIDDRWKTTPRTILQFVGTDLFRNQIKQIIPHIGENFWIEHFKLYYTNNINTNVVVSDIRFQNESKCVKDLNGIVIKIIRPDIISNDEHESEKNIDKITDIDYVVYNDGTKEQLYKKIDNIIKSRYPGLDLRFEF
jgi:hypothetical protein